MKSDKYQYFRCPYCGVQGAHGQKVSKRTGVFRIILLYNNVFIMQCQICLRTCRILTIGKPLKGKDMSPTERTAFKNPELQKELKSKVKEYMKGGKNEKSI